MVVFNSLRKRAEYVERYYREPGVFGFEMVRTHFIEDNEHSGDELLFYAVSAHAHDTVTPTFQYVHHAHGRMDVVRLFRGKWRNFQ